MLEVVPMTLKKQTPTLNSITTISNQERWGEKPSAQGLTQEEIYGEEQHPAGYAAAERDLFPLPLPV